MTEVLILVLAFVLLNAAIVAGWRALRGKAGSVGVIILRISITAILTAVPSLYGTWQLARSRTHQMFGDIVSRVETSQPVVALTFDDGPSAAHTNSILGVLDSLGVRATFFLTGKEIAANMEHARSIVAAGHEVGNHTYSHSSMIALPLDRIQREITATDSLLRAAGHEGPIHLRPPYSHKLLMLPWYARATDRTTIMFDVEPETYEGIKADRDGLVKRTLADVSPGSIILLHVMYESRDESRKAVPVIVDSLRNRGFSFVTVSELLRLERGADGP